MFTVSTVPPVTIVTRMLMYDLFAVANLRVIGVNQCLLVLSIILVLVIV